MRPDMLQADQCVLHVALHVAVSLTLSLPCLSLSLYAGTSTSFTSTFLSVYELHPADLDAQLKFEALFGSASPCGGRDGE